MWKAISQWYEGEYVYMHIYLENGNCCQRTFDKGIKFMKKITQKIHVLRTIINHAFALDYNIILTIYAIISTLSVLRQSQYSESIFCLQLLARDSLCHNAVTVVTHCKTIVKKAHILLSAQLKMLYRCNFVHIFAWKWTFFYMKWFFSWKIF